jgi:hypothetical protein
MEGVSLWTGFTWLRTGKDGTMLGYRQDGNKALGFYSGWMFLDYLSDY